jgi:hypothetical protein
MERFDPGDPFGTLAGAARVDRLRRGNAATLRARMQERLFEDVSANATYYDTGEPGGFLSEVMAGYDPRPAVSVVAHILANVRARGPGAMPTQAEWDELADRIAVSPLVRGEAVPLELSVRAAEKLAPFLYVKPVAGDSDDDGEASAPVTPLTPAEIAEFQDNWNDEY